MVQAPLAGLGRNVNENKCLAGVTGVPQTLRNKQKEPSPSLIREHNLLSQADAGGKDKREEKRTAMEQDENAGQKICGGMKGSHLFANKVLDLASMCILGSF